MMYPSVYSNEEIESWISSIPDPEIPVISIKDLGILRKVDTEGDLCEITITPTYTGCPAMGLIEDQIRELLSNKGITNVKVHLTYSPAWTTDWISEDAKKRMREYGISPPSHSSCRTRGNSNDITSCPRCGSNDTVLISKFGSTACKSLYKCEQCKEPYEHFKCH